MTKELKYFNGLEIVRLYVGENNVQSMWLSEDTAIVKMEDGTQRTIISPYIELKEKYESIVEQFKDTPLFTKTKGDNEL